MRNGSPTTITETTNGDIELTQITEGDSRVILLDWKRSLILHLLSYFAVVSMAFLAVDALIEYEFQSVTLMLIISPLGLMAAFVISAWMTGMIDYNDSDS